MARIMITGKETQKMQEYTQEQIDSDHRQKYQLRFRYAPLSGFCPAFIQAIDKKCDYINDNHINI